MYFVNGSHADIALSYWNGVEGDEYNRLESRYENSSIGGGVVSHHMTLEVGDIIVHNGWMLYCADAADEDEGEDSLITDDDSRAELREDISSFI